MEQLEIYCLRCKKNVKAEWNGQVGFAVKDKYLIYPTCENGHTVPYLATREQVDKVNVPQGQCKSA